MKISVVTPSYQQGDFIERTIQSVLSQSVAPTEYFVMDGGSSDQTLEILKKYQSQLEFISEPDRGQTHAINKGLAKVSGDVIGWLNSDDIYYPDAFKTVLEYFSAHPHIDVVYGNAYHIDEQDRVIDPYPVEDWNVKTLAQQCYISQPALFFRRSVFERFGLLNETLTYCMDYDYWIRLALGGAQVAHIPNILAGARLHGATKTASCSMPMQQEVMNMLYKHLGYVPTRWFLTYAYAMVKTKTSWKYFDPRFGLMILFNSMKTAVKYHGWIRGLITCCELPWSLAKLLYRKIGILRTRQKFTNQSSAANG